LKQHDEYKNVVDRERLFNEVAGQELKRRFAAETKVHEPIEDERERDPQHAPTERFGKANVSIAPMAQEIYAKRDDDEYAECCPRG